MAKSVKAVAKVVAILTVMVTAMLAVYRVVQKMVQKLKPAPVRTENGMMFQYDWGYAEVCNNNYVYLYDKNKQYMYNYKVGEYIIKDSMLVEVREHSWCERYKYDLTKRALINSDEVMEVRFFESEYINEYLCDYDVKKDYFVLTKNGIAYTNYGDNYSEEWYRSWFDCSTDDDIVKDAETVENIVDCINYKAFERMNKIK